MITYHVESLHEFSTWMSRVEYWLFAVIIDTHW